MAFSSRIEAEGTSAGLPGGSEEEDDLYVRSEDEAYIYVPSLPDDELYKDDFLSYFGLCVNLTASAIICANCGRGVPPSAVKTHIEKHSLPYSNRKYNTSMLSRVALLKAYPAKLVDQEVAWRPTVLPTNAFSYLEIIPKGFTCIAPAGQPACYHTTKMERSLKEHISKSHGRMGGYRCEKASMQTLFHGEKRSYFPVNIPPSIPVGTEVLYEKYEEMRKAMEVDTPRPQPLDERNTHPFFRTSRWYDLLEKYDRRYIVNLLSGVVRRNNQSEGVLKQAVYDYFFDVNKRLGKGTVHHRVLEQLSIKKGSDE